MSYELRVFEDFIYSDLTKTMLYLSTRISIIPIDVRGEIEIEYKRLYELYQNKLYSNKSHEEILFYFHRYGRRMIDLQRSVLDYMNGELKYLLSYGFDEDVYTTFRNSQHLYKALMKLLDLIYYRNSSLFPENSIPSFEKLDDEWKILEISNLKTIFRELREGKLGVDFKKIDMTDQTESFPKVISVNGIPIRFTREDLESDLVLLVEHDFEEVAFGTYTRRDASKFPERRTIFELVEQLQELATQLADESRISDSELGNFKDRINHVFNDNEVDDYEAIVENNLLQWGFYPEIIVQHIQLNIENQLSLLNYSESLEFLEDSLIQFKTQVSTNGDYKLEFSGVDELLACPFKILIDFVNEKIKGLNSASNDINIRKIKTKMTNAQIAKLFRMLKECGCIENVENSLLFGSVSGLFETNRSKNIDVNDLCNLYTKHNEPAMKFWNEKLKEFGAEIKKMKISDSK